MRTDILLQTVTIISYEGQKANLKKLTIMIDGARRMRKGGEERTAESPPVHTGNLLNLSLL